MTNPPEVTLQRALVAVYPIYIRGAIARYGVTVDEAFIDRGQSWLAEQLESLLSRPFSEQNRGPLEVFQEATGFGGEALAAVGVEPVNRRDVESRAMPGDQYDLAPASTRDLGRTVWEAHLRWGAAKAAELGDLGD